jgi:DNA-binding transcriptional MocR family regulator
MSAKSYLALADDLAEQIRDGTLSAGNRLPPVRSFAYERRIAPSTAARVYAELVRRGLVSGEVGRGTFVRDRAPAPRLGEPGRRDLIDLEFNATAVATGDAAGLAAVAARMLSAHGADVLAASSTAFGTARSRAALAAQVAQAGWRPDPDDILVCGGGRQAIAGAMAALTEPGQPIGVESLTYPMVKAIAQRLGRPLVSLAMDSEGVLPDAVADASRSHGVRVVYLQPALHNPLGITMGAERRALVVERATSHGVVLVEDSVYGFLKPDAPPCLAAFAPGQVVVVDSLSKRGFSGLPLGMLVVASEPLRERIAESLRSGAWLAAPLTVAIGTALAEDGTVTRLQRDKREDASRRQAVVRARLSDWVVEGDPGAYHLWLRLPPPWRAEPFVIEAYRRGVALSPASAFAVGANHAPDAVRLALAVPSLDRLSEAAARIDRVLRLGPMGPSTVE